MEAIRRLAVVFCLALALAFAGAARAMPLAHAQGAAMVEICADGETAVIYLDRKGNPVAPQTPCATCPDCLSPGAIGLTAPQPVPSRPALHPFPVLALPVALPHPARPHLRPETRGPPPVVRAGSDLAGPCLTEACK